MPKKKKLQQEAPEAAPAPVKKEKPKKPKRKKEFSPFPALFAMWFTLFLGGAGMVGVNMYQTYRDNVFAYEQAVRAQEQRAKALEENREKFDLIRSKKPQDVSNSPAPEAPAASTEPSQPPETPPDVPEEPVSTPAEEPAEKPSQEPQETKPAEKPSSSGDSPQSPGVTVAPSNEAKTSDTSKNTPTSSTSTTHDFSGGRVLITTKSDNNKDPVYHTRDCRAAKEIPAENVGWFDSEQAAIDDGRRLCGLCAK